MDHIRRVVVLSIINLGLSLCAEVKPQTIRKYMDACIELGKEPNFDNELVIDLPWSIYYAWNLYQLEHKCLTVKFKNATTRIVERFHNDMQEYMEQQPVWEAATLFVTMTGHQEMLLFAAQGPAGYFYGVPNVVKDAKLLLPLKKNVEPLFFQLKLFENDQLLVMMDCKHGVTTLMAREENKQKAVEFAASRKFHGDGCPACVD